MKFFLFCFCLCSAFLQGSAQSLNVMTFNIRLNMASDNANAWPLRKDKVITQVLFHQADILGVQEALPLQMDELQAGLSGYKYVGVGRDDGNRKGEFSAIFYNAERFSISESGTFWLSETPTVAGSKGWDASFPRIVTWIKARDKKSKKRFYFFNTHFDHMGVVARRESAEMLLFMVDSIAGKSPAIITGDFNASVTDEPIMIIRDNTNPLALTDSKELSESGHYGPDGTFNGWQIKDSGYPRIDYIFLKGSYRVKSHATLSQIWDGKFSSDHFPVFAEIEIK